VAGQVAHLLPAQLAAGPDPLVDGLHVLALVVPGEEGGGAARLIAGQPPLLLVPDEHVLAQVLHLHEAVHTALRIRIILDVDLDSDPGFHSHSDPDSRSGSRLFPTIKLKRPREN